MAVHCTRNMCIQEAVNVYMDSISPFQVLCIVKLLSNNSQLLILAHSVVSDRVV